MRRLAALTLTVLAIAAVPVALAATSATHTFTLPRGHTARFFAVHVSATGTFTVVLRYSDIVNPNVRLRVTLRRSSWPSRVLLIDTLTKRAGCQGAAGSIYCTAKRLNTKPGTYYVRVAKLTTARAAVTLKITHS